MSNFLLCENTHSHTKIFMEIDLNHVVSEVEGGSGSCLIYKELWHACAGPLTTLPNKGNVVVYFPQGHFGQVASASSLSHIGMPNFGLKPQIFCKIMDVQLMVSTNGFPCFCVELLCFLQIGCCFLSFVFCNNPSFLEIG